MEYYVAKSYENFPRICDPYEVNGKMYVKIRTTSGKEKVVRAYDKPQVSNSKSSPVVIIQAGKSRKDVLGFGEAGFIWLFKGNTYESLEWFKASPCRYAKLWGWYLPSNIDMPDPIPAGLTPIQLFWDEISLNGAMIADKDITTIVDAKLYDDDNSKWVGNIGDRLTLYLTCVRAIDVENMYGSSTFHIFKSEDGSTFTWSTSAKTLEVNHNYLIAGTVKDYQTYKGTKQTVLTRCMIKEDLGEVDENN